MKAVFFCSLKTPGTGVRFLITKKQARLHGLDTYCVTNEDQHLLISTLPGYVQKVL